MNKNNANIVKIVKKSKKNIELNKIQELINLGANLNETNELDEELGGSFFM